MMETYQCNLAIKDRVYTPILIINSKKEIRHAMQHGAF